MVRTRFLIMGLLVAGLLAFGLVARGEVGTADLGGGFLLHQQNAKPLLQIEGTLVCENTKENTEAACNIQIQDAKSGQLISLTGAAELIKMYWAGIKNVIVDGLRSSNGSVQVIQARAL